jgi:hypothetical protein
LKLLSTRHCTSVSALLTQRESSRTGKQLLRVVSDFVVIVSLGGVEGRAGSPGDGFKEPRGRWSERVWEPLLYALYATSRKVRDPMSSINFFNLPNPNGQIS